MPWQGKTNRIPCRWTQRLPALYVDICGPSVRHASEADGRLGRQGSAAPPISPDFAAHRTATM